jgi:hypothetical protein
MPLKTTPSLEIATAQFMLHTSRVINSVIGSDADVVFSSVRFVPDLIGCLPGDAGTLSRTALWPYLWSERTNSAGVVLVLAISVWLSRGLGNAPSPGPPNETLYQLRRYTADSSTTHNPAQPRPRIPMQIPPSAHSRSSRLMCIQYVQVRHCQPFGVQIHAYPRALDLALFASPQAL